MSKAELSGLEVIQQVKGKGLRQREAAERLGISARQVKRLCRAYRLKGAAGLVSGHRGRAPNNHLAAATVEQAQELLRSEFSDYGPTAAQEQLTLAGLKMSVETVRQMMRREGLWRVRKVRQPVVHQLRERRARVGEMIQLDGSPHDWFEGRAPKCTLLVLIDDASSQLMHLQFVESETTFNYFDAVRAYVTEFGKPLSWYSDKHSVFRVNLPDPLSGTGMTQFGRAMKELGIELICAHSPQAKGRVERVNQTLQDRLVKAMRRRGISTWAAGNAYLPEYLVEHNARFAVTPRAEETAHRPLHLAEDLDRILTLCEDRILSKNLQLSYHRVIYQIQTERASYTMRFAKVEVRETRTGAVTIEYKGQPLAYTIFRQQERAQGRIVSAKLLPVASTVASG
jgi:transposase